MNRPDSCTSLTTGSAIQPPDAALPFRLLHLTDLHLFADAGGRLLGQNTRTTFHSVLALARQYPADAVLFTGDLVQDETLAAYDYLHHQLQQLALPYYCIPGNHDRVDLIAGLLDPHDPTQLRVVPLSDWDLILLDSTIPHEPGGYLAPSILHQLRVHLNSAAPRPTVIALHHHPLACGSRWLDQLMVTNGDELLSSITHYSQVRAVIWGHTHQQFTAQYAALTLLSTPSTCIQFLPHSDTFALDLLPPGYRWIELYPDGQLRSEVVRIAGYPDPVQRDCCGY